MHERLNGEAVVRLWAHHSVTVNVCGW